LNEQRVRLESGKGKEIDIFVSALDNTIIAESKFRKEPSGKDVVENLIYQGNLVMEKRAGENRDLIQWLVD